MGFKWSVHPTLSMLVLYLIVTQQLFAYSLLMLSLLIHELGHIYTARFLKVQLRKLTLLPFGGQLLFMPTTNERMLLITCAGPIATLVCVALAMQFNWQLFLYMQFLILAFNCLPIWPLDGGQIVYYSLKLLWPNIHYEHYIQFSFALAIALVIGAIVVVAPLFFQLAAIILCFESYQTFRTRKYVQAVENTIASGVSRRF